MNWGLAVLRPETLSLVEGGHRGAQRDRLAGVSSEVNPQLHLPVTHHAGQFAGQANCGQSRGAAATAAPIRAMDSGPWETKADALSRRVSS